MSGPEPVRFRLCEHVSFTVIDDSAILLDGLSGKYLGLNEVGTRILQIVGEELRADDILEILLGEYDAPEEQVRADLERILRELESKSLIERRPGGRGRSRSA